MKVTAVDTTLVHLPLPKPIGTAIHSIESTGLVLVEVKTDSGVVGQSHIFTINGDRLKAFDEMVKGLSKFVIGQDPHDTGLIWSAIWQEINPTGHKGVTVSALSSLDQACWDAVGKAAELPLHKLFGGSRNEIDTYASSGLWLSYTTAELVAEAKQFAESGFRSMKIRVGSDDPLEDIARVRAVRDAVGPGVGLLADANQRFNPKAAIRLGRKLEQFDLIWFEEPVSAFDLQGHAEVKRALDVPIASGETEYTMLGMKAMLDANAADILMPDLQRIGGYTEFKKTAALAEANHIRVSSHFFTEASLCLAGSISNFMSVEHIDWFAPLFNETMELTDGKLKIPDRPGHGFTFNPEALSRYRI